MFKNFIVLTFITCFFVICAPAQSGISSANFSTGGTAGKTYEEFSFEGDENGRTKIEYSYRTGKYPKQIELTYLGTETISGKKYFKVQFPNELVMRISISGDALKVESEDGVYGKYFRWQYIGPVNGIGTWCESCLEEKEAIAFLKKFYFED